MTTAGRMVFLRNRMGLSQKAFAELMGRSVGYINRIENGRTEPTGEIVQAISETFGVPEVWLAEGTGFLNVESVGDRIRQARRSREYTQEELAEEIGISRNSVGMMERGTIKCSEDTVALLCEKLWIDRRWLLTGQGEMEKPEMTPFYEMLSRDPEVRAQIRRFIDHLDRQRSARAFREEEEEAEEPIVMVPAWVHDLDAARRFFRLYHIPFEEGALENAGRLMVRKTREIDWERRKEVEERFRKAKLFHLCDHPEVFRDEEDNTIVTFSPYQAEESSLPWLERLEESIYGFGTTTYVVKA